MLAAKYSVMLDKWFLIGIVLSTLLIHKGCSLHCDHAASSDSDVISSTIFQDSLENLYPQSFQAIHRCLLKVAGKQFVLDGYLISKHPGSFRLVAKGDMGGTAFELIKQQGQEPVIVQNAAGLRDLWLMRGAARDIEVIYFRKPSGNAVPFRRGEHLIGFFSNLPDGKREEYLFTSTGFRLADYMVLNGHRCCYKAHFTYHGTFPRWTREVPKTVTIIDFDMKYELSISVLDISEIEVDR